MKELSLHILDLAQNSLKADANKVIITIVEDLEKNKFIIEIEDDGKGMDKELLKIADDPFFTTRKTRKVGLGLSLMKATAERCDGNFKIESKKNKGTKVLCSLKHDHIDRPPLGNIGETIMILLNNEQSVEIFYRHYYNKKSFTFNTLEVKEMLKDVDIRTNEVLLWIKDYINENIKNLYTV
ncbi:ATP-binding protein [Thermohalobacter berrensis]|uniref:histidine kinase n=1 Tax=Thermohalobacter berrensis TaxID=99594 RepID=A0A419T6Z4_9FIRM|nr:ATP-binding protein [Thermohalobacter berrensis]RKD33189.1 histidine kinase [Thermohalobacter berrensis]